MKGNLQISIFFANNVNNVKRIPMSWGCHDVIFASVYQYLVPYISTNLYVKILLLLAIYSRLKRCFIFVSYSIFSLVVSSNLLVDKRLSSCILLFNAMNRVTDEAHLTNQCEEVQIYQLLSCKGIDWWILPLREVVWKSCWIVDMHVIPIIIEVGGIRRKFDLTCPAFCSSEGRMVSRV